MRCVRGRVSYQIADGHGNLRPHPFSRETKHNEIEQDNDHFCSHEHAEPCICMHASERGMLLDPNMHHSETIVHVTSPHWCMQKTIPPIVDSTAEVKAAIAIPKSIAVSTMSTLKVQT